MIKSVDTPRHIGISCSEPDLLRNRLLISNLEILDPSAAQERGYGCREVIVPTAPHKPTDDQLEAIIATENTSDLLRLTLLPASIGHTAARLCQEPDFTMNFENYSDLGEGFIGAPLGYRLDQPGQINVAVDHENLKVGDHIDNTENSDVRFAVLNMGPGTRLHRITPAFSRDDMDGQRPSPERRHEHMKSLIEAGLSKRLLAYWILLDAPSVTRNGELMVEAIMPSPVARYLHDGSTYEAKEESTAVFISTPPGMPTAPYVSLV